MKTFQAYIRNSQAYIKTLATILLLTLTITASYSIGASKNTDSNTVKNYRVKVTSRDIYIPYHLFGLEKTLKANKDISNVKIIPRAGNVSFTFSATEKPTEPDIIKIFSQFSLTPSSVKIRLLK